MQKNKPVILLIDNSVAFTGAYKCAIQQAEALREVYHYIFLIPKGSILAPLIREKGFQCYTLPMLEIKKSISTLIKYFPVLIRNTFKIKQIVVKEAVDVVIMNDFYNMLGILSKLSGYQGKLVTYIRFIPNSVPSVLRRIWLFLAFKYADKILAVSDAVLNQLPESEKAIKLYDAVQFEEIYPEKRTVDTNTVNLLYLGNYIVGKGQDHALAAFKIAYQQNKYLRLIFAGGDMGLEKNKQFRQKLQDEVEKAGLINIVHFLPFEKDVEALIKDSSIVLNFSESESFSMTCAEACYYGVPVIATRCGGPEEIIVNEYSGLLVENKNVQQMAEAILKLSSSVQLQQQFGKNARNFVREKFSLSVFTTSFKSLVDSLFNNHKHA